MQHIEPLRESRIAQRVFHFKDIRFFASRAVRNLDRDRVRVRLDRIGSDNGIHFLWGNQKVATYKCIERCKPSELRSTFRHALSNFLVLHFLDFKTTKVTDKTRQIDNRIFRRRDLDFVIKLVADKDLCVIDICLDRQVKSISRNN